MVKCQMGVCRADESEDSPDSCKNGQLQILVSEEAQADPFRHKFLTFPIPSETETGFKLRSASDCEEALGKGSPHPRSVCSLQCEAMLGGTSQVGGQRSWGERT